MIQSHSIMPEFNGWEVEFDADFDCAWEEPDRSVGFNGGWTVEFVKATIGTFPITRDILVQMTSRAEVEAIEERIADGLGYGWPVEEREPAWAYDD